jgi:type VI secretion system protein ImpK
MHTEDIANSTKQNALLHAAQDLLQQINQPIPSNNREQHYHALCQSVAQFESQCNNEDYSRSEINDACFFLCALLDETTTWPTPFVAKFCDPDANKDTEFFIRLKRRQENPPENIDLLEMAYLCLSLGFKGQYRSDTTDNRIMTVIDDLYAHIQQQRDEQPASLFQPQKVKPITKWYWPPIWLTLLITALILLFIFIPYHQKLNQLTTPAAQMINKITKTTE